MDNAFKIVRAHVRVSRLKVFRSIFRYERLITIHGLNGTTIYDHFTIGTIDDVKWIYFCPCSPLINGLGLVTASWEVLRPPDPRIRQDPWQGWCRDLLLPRPHTSRLLAFGVPHPPQKGEDYPIHRGPGDDPNARFRDGREGLWRAHFK